MVSLSNHEAICTTIVREASWFDKLTMTPKPAAPATVN